MSDDELIPIGAFARRVGLTTSALRFYDDAGALRPAEVEADAVTLAARPHGRWSRRLRPMVAGPVGRAACRWCADTAGRVRGARPRGSPRRTSQSGETPLRSARMHQQSVADGFDVEMAGRQESGDDPGDLRR
ncbi:MerR family DNA-binding transcriptional regulator [Aeromicrobium sp.]|uniref:MerR family DNA-binding transcriptional regulator n=1 Tax=Aeromicrobium sp. TaxID=1871063 RepID=UPI0039E3105D